MRLILRCLICLRCKHLLYTFVFIIGRCCPTRAIFFFGTSFDFNFHKGGVKGQYLSTALAQNIDFNLLKMVLQQVSKLNKQKRRLYYQYWLLESIGTKLSFELNVTISRNFVALFQCYVLASVAAALWWSSSR